MTRLSPIVPAVLLLLVASDANGQTWSAERRATSWLTTSDARPSALFPIASTIAQDQSKTKDAPNEGFRLVWNDRPSIRIGKAVRIDVRVKLQADYRASEWDGLEDGNTEFEFARKRVGVQGEVTKYVEFEIEADLQKDDPWRDVFVNVKPATAFEVKGGKFKMPFNYDQLTGPANLDFVSRSLIGRTIAPARDIGVMVHGRLFKRILTYEIGAFRNDGENAKLEEGFLLPGEAPPHDEHSAALRLSVEPFRRASGRNPFERLHVAVAFTTSQVPEGLNSLSGESVLGFTYFEPVYTNGRRQRFGAELVWMPGPFSIKSEYARAEEARLGQGFGDVDLSNFISSGWYVSGTWALTGEKKQDGIEPRRPLFQGGAGAFELAIRYDELGFGSALTEGEAFANPRADPVLENRDHVWTVGVNWYLNKWAKIQINGIRESFQDTARSPMPGQTSVWSGVGRLQFVL